MAWQNLPNDDKTHESMAIAQAEALTAFGLKDHEIEVWEDGYRAAATEDDTFEWWYFDVQFDDGSTLVVTFSNKPHTAPSEPINPVLLVIRQLADGTSRKVELPFPADQFTASTDSCDVRIGANTVTGNLEAYDLHLEVDGLVADVHIDRVAPSWRPGAGLSYFDEAKTQYLAWVVPVPYGTVTASLTEDGRTSRLVGSAYHDHNWGNRLMGDFLDHWYWGRAHVGEYTLVYVMLFNKGFLGLGRFQIPTFYLAKGGELVEDDMLPLRLETSDDVPGPLHQTYPRRLEWTWEKEGRGRISFTATDPTLIEALDMRTPRHGFAHLAHANEHPAYFDFNANLELTIDLDGLSDHVTGRTLYEKMMFR